MEGQTAPEHEEADLLARRGGEEEAGLILLEALGRGVVLVVPLFRVAHRSQGVGRFHGEQSSIKRSRGG